MPYTQNNFCLYFCPFTNIWLPSQRSNKFQHVIICSSLVKEAKRHYRFQHITEIQSLVTSKLTNLVIYKTMSVLTSCIYSTTYSRTCSSVSVSTVCNSCSNCDAPTWFCSSDSCPHTQQEYQILIMYRLERDLTDQRATLLNTSVYMCTTIHKLKYLHIYIYTNILIQTITSLLLGRTTIFISVPHALVFLKFSLKKNRMHILIKGIFVSEWIDRHSYVDHGFIVTVSDAHNNAHPACFYGCKSLPVVCRYLTCEIICQGSQLNTRN